MKKLLVMLGIVWMATIAPVSAVKAQDPITLIIKEAIKKVVKAADLQIQRLQNKTIWLQNAQKALENELSKLKLDEISDWTEKQRKLYSGYYEELRKVKSIIAYYNKVKDITTRQARVIGEYKRAWALIREDKHFSADELDYMARVYGGILEQSVQNMEQIYMVINSFQTQMTDAKRLELINTAAAKVDENYFDLTRFNTQNAALSVQRSKDLNEAATMKKMYGIK